MKIKTAACIALMCIAGTSSGCASVNFSTVLVDDYGHANKCSASGWGWLGTSMATKSYSKCVADLEKFGWAELPDVTIGVQMEPGSNQVARVLDDSGASRADIRAGDRITEVDGRSIHGVTDIYRALRNRKAGDAVPVVVDRDGRPIVALVQLANVVKE
jgi:S1-C subfamily serine protease